MILRLLVGYRGTQGVRALPPSRSGVQSEEYSGNVSFNSDHIWLLCCGNIGFLVARLNRDYPS